MGTMGSWLAVLVRQVLKETFAVIVAIFVPFLTVKQKHTNRKLE